MLDLKKKRYPLEQTLGGLEFIKIFTRPEDTYIINTLQLVILLLKHRFEGFRVSIFLFAILKILGFLSQSQLIASLMSLYFMYFSHNLTVLQLPQAGPPVGHKWFRGGWLHKYNLQECSIFYPATITPKDKLGVRWNKVKDYAGRMNDTAKKDVKRVRNQFTPSFFFKVIVSQFEKLYMWVFEGAQLKQSSTPYEVIVLSHGLASHCDGYSVVARNLAQIGYIVICPEHFEHIRNVFPTDEENKIYRTAQLHERFKVIQGAIDIIYDQPKLKDIFGREVKINYQTGISIIGHSFGGTTSVYCTFHDPRITGCCIAYDPCMYVFDPQVCNLDFSKLKIPVFIINAHDFYRRLYPFMENDERLIHFFDQIEPSMKQHCIQVYINDQQHADFSDLPIIWNGEAGLYKVSGNVHQVHIRLSLILELSRAFLMETKRFHQVKNDKDFQQKNLQEYLLNHINKVLGTGVSDLIRWKALP